MRFSRGSLFILIMIGFQPIIVKHFVQFSSHDNALPKSLSRLDNSIIDNSIKRL